MKNTLFYLILFILVMPKLTAQNTSKISPSEWGSPDVFISSSANNWTVKRVKHILRINGDNLSMQVDDGTVTWQMFPYC